MLAGVYLIATAGWELLLVGAASILAGVLYTGGPRPYGYEGLGEVFVFLFFGVVAVTGSYFAQTEELDWEALVLAVPVGLLASAILVVNNVRDLETDRRAGKRTLAVRLGRERARGLFAAMVAGAFLDRAAAVAARLAVAVAAAELARAPARRCRSSAIVRTRTDGPALNGALAGTGQLQLAFCVLLSAGLLATLDVARLEVAPVRLALRAPLRTAWGELRERELLRVRLDLGGRRRRARRGGAARALRRRLARRGRRGAARPTRRGAARRRPARRPRRAARRLRAPSATCPQALAAVDLALWDRAGRRAGRPVAHLLAAGAAAARAGQRDDRRRGPRGGGRAGAAAAARAGFGCVKVKVGIGDDAGRVAAVRAAVGPGVAIRVDANGAWATPSEALANLRALAPAGLEFAEEPVHGVDGAARGARRRRRCRSRWTRRAAEPGAAGSGAADAVCLKIARCGGITGVLRDARGGARGGLRRSTSRRRSTGRSASPRACTWRRRWRPRGRWRRAGWRRWARSHGPRAGVLAPVRGAIAVPGRAPACSASAPDGAVDRRSTPRQRREQLHDRVRRLELHRVPGARHDVHARVRQRRRHPLRDRAELLVALPHHELDRDRQLPQPVPQRRHHARAEPAQRRGEPGRRVAPPVGVARAPRPRAGCRRTAAARPIRARTPRARSPRCGRRAPRRPRARAARSAGSASPGLAPTSTSRATRAPSASAACSAIRPPIE